MSQINTVSELTLKNEQFLATLRATEAEFRAFVARIGGMSVNVPMTPQQHVQRAVGSAANQAMIGAGAAQVVVGGRPGMESLAGEYQAAILAANARGDVAAAQNVMRQAKAFGFSVSGVAAPGVAAAAKSVQTGVANVASAAEDSLKKVATDLNRAAQDVTAQSNVGAQAAAGTGTPAAAGGPFGIGFLKGRGGYMIGHLIAYYGVSRLIDQIDRRANVAEAWETGGDTQDIAKDQLKSAMEENTGVLGLIRRNSSTYKAIYGDPVENIRTVREQLRQSERVKVTGELSAKAIDDQREIEQKTAVTIGDSITARTIALDDWLEEQEKTVADLNRRGKGDQARRLQAAARNYVTVEKAAMQQAESAADQASQSRVAEFQTQGGLSGMREVGLGRQAAYVGRRSAVMSGLRKLRDEAAAATGPKQARLWQQYMAASAAAVNELGAIDFAESQTRAVDITSTENSVYDTRERSYLSRLRIAGNPREAALEERRYAIATRVRDARDAYRQETDPTRKAQLKRILDETTASAGLETQEVEADERRRRENSIAEFVISKHHAMHDAAAHDFRDETKIFVEQWDLRLKKMRESGATADEIRAAQAQRSTESATRNLRNRLRNLSITDEGVSARLRAGGGDQLAELIEFRANLHEELREAGGDRQLQQAIISRSRGQLQEMARRLTRPQRFGSFADYFSSVQDSAFRGTGGVMAGMQQLYQALGGIKPGDKAMKQLEDGSEKLDKAADKMLRAPNVFILHD